MKKTLFIFLLIFIACSKEQSDKQKLKQDNLSIKNKYQPNEELWDKIDTLSGNVSYLVINNKGEIFAISNGSALKSLDKGKSWTIIDSSLSLFHEYTTLFLFSDSIMFLGTCQNGLFVSYDKGKNWFESQGGRSSINAIIKSKDNHIILSTAGGYYESLDTGKSWVDFNLSFSGVRWLTINTQGTILAGTSDPYSNNLFEVYRCSDSDYIWDNINPDTSDHIELVPSNGKAIFINTKYGLRCSLDNGMTWSMPDKSAPEHPESIIETDSGEFFVSDEFNGVYRSIDDCKSWEKYNDGLRTLLTNCLALHPDGYLYVATNKGIFRSIKQVK
jgi:photosystem II stability/assembly factor-like uncharacterized protein